MGKPGDDWPQDAIDESMFDDEHDVSGDDEWEMECGLARDGCCSQAGTEHCDFGCPNRNSELFRGSEAWMKKHARRNVR